jgi:Transposase DDE domain group 1
MTEATLFLPGLSPVGGKTITATFDGGKLSSNGGVLILREIERKLGLAAVLSRHIPDDRDRTRITHSYSDMTRARMFAIASGHEDCDDLDVLRSDPALKMACGRLPVRPRWIEGSRQRDVSIFVP